MTRSRHRTFELDGHIVSVVPAADIHEIHSDADASKIALSAEREGGAALLLELLGAWRPLVSVRRDELRRLVVKEIRHHSVLLRRPLRQAMVYRAPEPVDLRELLEPAPLGADTIEPTQGTGVEEPSPWVELEVVDTRGRRVLHFRGRLRGDGDERRFDTSSGRVLEEHLSGDGPVEVSLNAHPETAEPPGPEHP